MLHYVFVDIEKHLTEYLLRKLDGLSPLQLVIAMEVIMTEMQMTSS